MNNVILIGRLTRDPELRTTANGTSTTAFSLAVDGYRNANGEVHTDFINIVVWNKQAENVCKFVKKGSQVGIQGRISTRSYDAQDGTKRYVTEVVASNVTFLGSRADNTSSNFESSSSFENAETADFSENTYSDFDGDTTLSEDDDLPF
jgi:single-strand DNA-binding protein